MNASGRVIALDVGDVRIGVAVSDPARIISQPVEVYRRVGYGPDSRYIRALCDRYQTRDVLLGLPLNMDGSEGKAALGARDLVKRLKKELQNKKISCEVEVWDERLTSFEAEQRARQQGVAKAKAKAFLDSLAAEVLLEDYLASHPEK